MGRISNILILALIVGALLFYDKEMRSKGSNIVLGFLILFFILVIYRNRNRTGFESMYSSVPADTRTVYDTPLLADSFPVTGNTAVTNNTYENISHEYPKTEFGSMNQVTNNMRHVSSPDNGTCTPAEFCGALYAKKSVPSNEKPVVPEQAEHGSGARVGFFRTQQNVLPFTIENNHNVVY